MKIKILLLVCFIAPFALISIYNQPAIDDFWNANTVMEHGRLGAVSFYFQTVSGRFFSNFLMSVLNTLPQGSIFIFKLWPVVVILMLFGSFYFLYRSIFLGSNSIKQAATASLLFVVLHIANIRVLFEGLYWMSASICYQVAICLFAVGVGAIVRCVRKRSMSCTAVAATCSILLPGSAETLAPVYILTLAAIAVVSFKRRYRFKPVIFVLTVAICGFVFVALSKGNNARVGDVSSLTYPQILQALFNCVKAVCYYCFYWLTTPINLAALVIVVPFVQRFVKQKTFHLPGTGSNLYILSVILFVLCCVIFLPQLLFESQIPSPRITTLVFFFASHYVLFCIGIALVKHPRFSQLISSFSSAKKFNLYAWTLFTLCAFTSTNFRLVVNDLVSKQASAFNEEANARYDLIKNTQGDTCYVTRFKNWPAFVQISKKENYPFVHMNRYYKKTILYKD